MAAARGPTGKPTGNLDVANELLRTYPQEWPLGLQEIENEEVVHRFCELRQWSDRIAREYGARREGVGSRRPAVSQKELHEVQADMFEYLNKGFLSRRTYLSVHADSLGEFERALGEQGNGKSATSDHTKRPCTDELKAPAKALAEWRTATVDLDLRLARAQNVSLVPQRWCERIQTYLMQCNPSLAYLDDAGRKTFEERMTRVCMLALDFSLQVRRCKTRNFKIIVPKPNTLITPHQASRINITRIAPGQQMPKSFLGGKIVKTLWGGLCVEDIPVEGAAESRILELPRVMADPM